MNAKTVLGCILFVCMANFICLLAETNKTASSTHVIPGVYTWDATGKYILATNVNEMWSGGVWAQGKSGLRIELFLWPLKASNPMVGVGVGSVMKGSGTYVVAPNGKFAKFELVDSNKVTVLPKNGQNMVGVFQPRISAESVPRPPRGGWRGRVGFQTNTGPEIIHKFRIDELYQISKEGDYELTVCPVIYSLESNDQYFERLDLTTVSTKVHLNPNLPMQ